VETPAWQYKTVLVTETPDMRAEVQADKLELFPVTVVQRIPGEFKPSRPVEMLRPLSRVAQDLIQTR